MTTTIEEPVLVPDGAKISKLREARGWTLDDAVFEARRRKPRLALSRQTLVDIEKGKGCRLATLGWVAKLYSVDPFSIVREVADPPRRPSA